MTYSKEAKKIRQRVNSTYGRTVTNLTSTNTTVVVDLHMAASKVTIQTSGTLTCTVAMSANGEKFSDSPDITIGTAGAMGTYSTNLVGAMTLTWTAGSGNVTILAIQ